MVIQLSPACAPLESTFRTDDRHHGPEPPFAIVVLDIKGIIVNPGTTANRHHFLPVLGSGSAEFNA